jgi:hypothetical protein
MSDIVKQIREGFEQVIQDQLGSDWRKADYKFDITKNQEFNTNKRFAVVVNGGAVASSILNHYTIAREFNVVVMNRFTNVNGDTNQQTELDNLESALDNIAIKAVSNKLGSPNLVTSVTFDAIEEPIFDIENTVILSATFVVTYRQRVLNC